MKLVAELGAASEWRPRIVPEAEPDPPGPEMPVKKKRKSGYRTWAELLARTWAMDALACPACQG